MRVFIYRNIRKGDWSIKALEGDNKGRVIGHASYARLQDAEPVVSEAGRQRVLKEQRKNVHAGIRGTLKAWYPSRTPFIWAIFLMIPPKKGKFIAYNPYKYKSFVEVDDTSRAVTGKQSHVLMYVNGAVLAAPIGDI